MTLESARGGCRLDYTRKGQVQVHVPLARLRLLLVIVSNLNVTAMSHILFPFGDSSSIP